MNQGFGFNTYEHFFFSLLVIFSFVSIHEFSQIIQLTISSRVWAFADPTLLGLAR